MLRKLALGFAVLALSGFAFAAGAGNEAAAFEGPPPEGFRECPGWPGDHGCFDHPWLRLSIIEAAADVINVPIPEVREGLRNGLSLNQIAASHGVGAGQLQLGILVQERQHLRHLVWAGKLTPHEAFHINVWLTTHMDGIVSHHFECLMNPGDMDQPY